MFAFGPGQRRHDLVFPTGERWGWRAKEAKELLRFDPGKHAVRVAFTCRPKDEGKPVRAISNPVEIEILPVPEDTGELSFGPVIERVVYYGAGAERLIDLESGKLFGSPSDMDSADANARRAWMVERSIDAEALPYRGSVALSLVDLMAAPATGEWWDTLPATGFKAMWARLMIASPLIMTGADELPATYAFKTREGGMGVLQIVGFTEDPPGVKIRYKMVQTITETAGQAISKQAHVLRVTVLGPQGRAVANGQVALMPPFSREPCMTDDTGSCEARIATHAWQKGDHVYLVARHVGRGLATVEDLGEVDPGEPGANLPRSVEVTLRPAMTIAGLLRDEQGKPVSDGPIHLRMRSSNGWFSAQPSVRSGPDGRFEFPCVPAGRTYRAEASARNFGRSEQDIVVPLGHQGLFDMGELVLQRAPFSISGTVVDAELKPISGAMVMPQGKAQPRRPVRSDSLGRFLIQGLVPGKVEVSAWHQGGVSCRRVDVEAGAIDLCLVLTTDGGYLATDASPDIPLEEPSARGFAAAIERVVGEDVYLDLDTGRILAPPGDLRRSYAQAMSEWAKKVGVDAVAMIEAEFEGLMGLEMIAIPTNDEEWASSTGQRLSRDELWSTLKAGTPVLMPAREHGELTATYFFRTREGGMGILQIVGFTEKPPGVKIRYKMVQQTGKPAPPEESWLKPTKFLQDFAPAAILQELAASYDAEVLPSGRGRSNDPDAAIRRWELFVRVAPEDHEGLTNALAQRVSDLLQETGCSIGGHGRGGDPRRSLSFTFDYASDATAGDVHIQSFAVTNGYTILVSVHEYRRSQRERGDLPPAR